MPHWGGPESYLHLSLDPTLYTLALFAMVGYFGLAGVRILLDRLQPVPAIGWATLLLSPLVYSSILLLTVIWSRQKTVFLYLRF